MIQSVKRFEITDRFVDTARDSIEPVRQIPLHTADVAIVPLGEVVNITIAAGYSFVPRGQLRRYVVVQMDVKGRDVDGFGKEANAVPDAKNDLAEVFEPEIESYFATR